MSRVEALQKKILGVQGSTFNGKAFSMLLGNKMSGAGVCLFDRDSIRGVEVSEAESQRLRRLAALAQINESAVTWLESSPKYSYIPTRTYDGLISQLTAVHHWSMLDERDSQDKWSDVVFESENTDLSYVGHVNKCGQKIGDVYIQKTLELMVLKRKEILLQIRNYCARSQDNFGSKLCKVICSDSFTLLATRRGGDENNIMIGVDLGIVEDCEMSAQEKAVLKHIFRKISYKIVCEVNETFKKRGYKIPVNPFSQEDFLSKNSDKTVDDWEKEFEFVTPRLKSENELSESVKNKVQQRNITDLLDYEENLSELELDQSKSSDLYLESLKNQLENDYPTMVSLADVISLTKSFLLLERGRVEKDRVVLEWLLFHLNAYKKSKFYNANDFIDGFKQFLTVYLNRDQRILPYLLGMAPAQNNLHSNSSSSTLFRRISFVNKNWAMSVTGFINRMGWALNSGPEQLGINLRFIGLLMHDNVTWDFGNTQEEMASALEKPIYRGWIMKARIKIANTRSEHHGDRQLRQMDRYLKDIIQYSIEEININKIVHGERILGDLIVQGRLGADNYVIITQQSFNSSIENHAQRMSISKEEAELIVLRVAVILECNIQAAARNLETVEYQAREIFAYKNEFGTRYKAEQIWNRFPAVISKLVVDKEGLYDLKATEQQSEDRLAQLWIGLFCEYLVPGTQIPIDDLKLSQRSGFRLRPITLLIILNEIEKIKIKMTRAIEENKILQNDSTTPTSDLNIMLQTFDHFIINNRGSKYLNLAQNQVDLVIKKIEKFGAQYPFINIEPGQKSYRITANTERKAVLSQFSANLRARMPGLKNQSLTDLVLSPEEFESVVSFEVTVEGYKRSFNLEFFIAGPDAMVVSVFSKMTLEQKTKLKLALHRARNFLINLKTRMEECSQVAEDYFSFKIKKQIDDALAQEIIQDDEDELVMQVSEINSAPKSTSPNNGFN